MTPEEIRAALKRTWVPFFSRFGRLTPIQVQAVPRILAGENVVVISPAATGKTEAVIAPALENIKPQNRPGRLEVLYISPTRALVNDLHRRLEEPVAYLGMTLGRKTGDRPRIDAKNLPAVLLTTPESFDSMIARRPAIFNGLKTVILDEIHLLDNTPRGDQLRVLLRRLRRIRDGLQYCALSATVDDPGIGGRYFPDDRVCQYDAPREIDYRLIAAGEFLPALRRLAGDRGLKKVLIFFNARSLVESFSQKFAQESWPGCVLVHHASLPKPRREEVEKAMNQSERAVMLATSTLELGIDIGDVDCVVIYRPPYNISSLLQRTGRGNRRTERLFALGVYTNNWEQIVFDTFFDCARRGWLYERRYRPLLSIIPQQIYSYLYQRRRIGTTLKSIYGILCDEAAGYEEPEVKKIFRKLLSDGVIRESRPGIYHVTDRIESKIEYGKIHSNINEKTFGEYDVYDIATSALIGRVYYVLEKFILGGKCWEKVAVSEKQKRVEVRFAGSAPAVSKVFEGKGAGNHNYLLAPVLKKQLFPNLADREFPFVFDGRHTHILHLLGPLGGLVIAEALTAEARDVIDVEGRLLTLNNYRLADDRFPVPGRQSVCRVIADRIYFFEDALGSGAFLFDLPHELQVEDIMRSLDVEGLLAYLGSLKLVEIDAGVLAGVVRHISAPDKRNG